MPRPIKLTDDLIRKMVEEFENSLRTTKMAEGKLTYCQNFTYESGDKAHLYFNAKAWAKMCALLRSFDSEVAWHGVGERLEGDGNYLISDILVYPQSVSGTTVEMDTDKYADWIIDNAGDERFDNIVLQGHSHVNMATNPSSVDISHQEEILAQLSGDMFYVFVIYNKKLENNIRIYDLGNNTFYDTKDVVVDLYENDDDIDAFLEEAHDAVQKKTYTAPTTTAVTTYTGGAYSYSGGSYGGTGSSYTTGGYYQGGVKTTPEAVAVSKKDKKDKKKNKARVGGDWNGRGSEDMDDIGYGGYGSSLYDAAEFHAT